MNKITYIPDMPLPNAEHNALRSKKKKNYRERMKTICANKETRWSAESTAQAGDSCMYCIFSDMNCECSLSQANISEYFTAFDTNPCCEGILRHTVLWDAELAAELKKH